MASRNARLRFGGSAVWLLGLVLTAGLSGCNGAIDTYRSISGMDKNDPNPETAPFSKNLAEAESDRYPNLATVPPPPILNSTAAERAKLADNLTEVRTNTQANGGTATPGSIAPLAPIPADIAAPPSSTAPAKQARAPLTPMRKEDEPPAPQPPNTTMQTPMIVSLPGVEAPRPAPPPGRIAPIPQPAPSALPAAVVQSANPQPAPPPATLPPPQLPPQIAALPPPKLPPVPVTVASFTLGVNATALPDAERPHLAGVVTQFKDKPRTVRIVSYAAQATGGAEQLNSFRGALDRAQLVAKALTDSGIPANKIQTQAAPASSSTPPGHIDVQFLP
ncbi:MAG TPA: hypothetical protein VMI30_01350 [Stellaceae bacterium]|nr:hypothetical protein [Stellaceae bacterium]